MHDKAVKELLYIPALLLRELFLDAVGPLKALSLVVLTSNGVYIIIIFVSHSERNIRICTNTSALIKKLTLQYSAVL